MRWSSGAGAGEICAGSTRSPSTINLSLCCCYHDHGTIVTFLHTLSLQTRRDPQPPFPCSSQCWFCRWTSHCFNSIFFPFLLFFIVLFFLLTMMEEVHQMAKRSWVPLSLLLHGYHYFLCRRPSYRVFLQACPSQHLHWPLCNLFHLLLPLSSLVAFPLFIWTSPFHHMHYELAKRVHIQAEAIARVLL